MSGKNGSGPALAAAIGATVALVWRYGGSIVAMVKQQLAPPAPAPPPGAPAPAPGAAPAAPAPPKPQAAGPLSARRLAALAAVSAVVPSKYGDARFSELAPSYTPDDPKLPKGFTTCGYLPGYVGGKIGVPTRYGLASIRTEAQKHGAWVEAGGDRRPKPGDFFLIGTASGMIAHTGVIVDAGGSLWKTADAGQGARDKQEARFVDRPYDAAAVTLGGPAGPRPLIGWMDIDKMPGGGGLAGLGNGAPDAAPVLLVDGGTDGDELGPASKKKKRGRHG